MKYLVVFFLAALTTGCTKESEGNDVAIYLLKSFTAAIDTSYYPAVTIVTNAVADSVPLVANNEITAYIQATNTFKLSKNIYDRVKNLGPDKAFVVVAGNQPVYYGLVHPAYLNSLRFGIATIDPWMVDNELAIQYVMMTGPGNFGFLQKMDKRNDSRLLEILRSSGRLR